MLITVKEEWRDRLGRGPQPAFIGYSELPGHLEKSALVDG